MQFREALRIAVSSIRVNRAPAMVLQGFLFVFLVLYFNFSGVRGVLEWMADLKVRTGYGFAVVSYIIAAAILPECFRVLIFQRGAVGRQNFRNVIAVVPLWGAMGIAVDTLYRMQILAFGDSNAIATLVAKVAVDQFVFTPFFSAPLIAGYMAWRNAHFARERLRSIFTAGFIRESIFPLIVAGWCVWIPGVSVVYFMPSGLQLPTALIIQVFWVLLITTITVRTNRC